MVKKENWFLCQLAVLPFLLCTCRKPDECVRRAGERTTETRTIQPFDRIVLQDDLNLELIQSSAGTLTLEGGKNLLAGIEIRQDSNMLTFQNRNTCNWTRDLDPQITIRVAVPELNLLSVEHKGYGKLSSANPLKINYLLLGSFEAGGDMDLQVQNALLVALYSNTQADLAVSGSTKEFSATIDGIGRVRAENLRADSVKVQHRGSNEIRVFPVEKLDVVIEENGNVVYYNPPKRIISRITGSGKLLKK
jgi:hypothetical protein